jgi:hypothetical protein
MVLSFAISVSLPSTESAGTSGIRHSWPLIRARDQLLRRFARIFERGVEWSRAEGKAEQIRAGGAALFCRGGSRVWIPPGWEWLYCGSGWNDPIRAGLLAAIIALCSAPNRDTGTKSWLPHLAALGKFVSIGAMRVSRIVNLAMARYRCATGIRWITIDRMSLALAIEHASSRS